MLAKRFVSAKNQRGTWVLKPSASSIQFFRELFARMMKISRSLIQLLLLHNRSKRNKSVILNRRKCNKQTCDSEEENKLKKTYYANVR